MIISRHIVEEIYNINRYKYSPLFLPVTTATSKYDIERNIEKQLKINDIAIIYYRPTESIQSHEENDKLLEIIKPYDGKYKLTQSILDIKDNLTHPYTNIYLWNDYTINKNIYNTRLHGRSKMWHNSLLDNNKTDKVTKKHKHILSVRRKTRFRDIIISRIDSKKIDIFRYLDMENEDQMKSTDTQIISKSTNIFPLWQELIQEYQQTYFGFILETNYGMNWPYTPFTEKTLIPFITKTIPLLFAHKNVNKKLHELGFWTANNDFGYQQYDELETDDIERVQKYIEMVNTVTDMTDKQIHEYYFDNYNHIYQNWKLLTDIFKIGKTTI